MTLRRSMGVVLLVLAIPAHAEPARAGIDTSPTLLRSQLADAKYARIGIDGRTFVFAKPRYAAEGLEYRRVENWKQRRPSIVTDDDGTPPPAPVPWSRIDRLEVGTTSRGPGIAFGAAAGLVAGMATGAAIATYTEGSDEWSGVFAIGGVFALLGAGFGALAPSIHWQSVDRSSDVTGSDLTHQLAVARYARVGIAGQRRVLEKPSVTPEGLGYARLQGDRPSPNPIVPGTGTHLTPLPNPVPWTTIDRIEAGHRTRVPGALIGGALALAIGIPLAADLEDLGEQGDLPPTTSERILSAAVCAGIGAGIGALFPVTRWKTVYR